MVQDRREFIRLDVAYLDNPKVSEVLDESPVAVLLHIASMALSRQHRTDGVISRRQVIRKVGATDADAELLIRLGLWHDAGGGKIEVHDYAKHQETRAEIEARSEAARKAIKKRWDRSPDTSGNTERNTERITAGTAPRSSPSNTEERRGEERREEAPLVSPTRDAARDARYEDDRNPMEGTSPKTVLPRGFSATTRHKALAIERGLDIGEELAAFREHAKAHGRSVVDWDAAFNVWLLASAKRAKQQGAEKRPGSSVWEKTTGGTA